MPQLYRTETRIRETCEDDTALELRLCELADAASQLRAQILADGRVDNRDLPALLSLLELVPQLRADCLESLRYNRQVNGLFGQLSSERRAAARWAKPEPSGGMEQAA